mgnify:CR=1 FL=1
MPTGFRLSPPISSAKTGKSSSRLKALASCFPSAASVLWVIRAWMTRKSLPPGELEQEFVFRASHLERIVEVYNDRLDRWETEALQDLVASVPYQATFQAVFTHAGKQHLDIVKLGWFKIRIPGKAQELWVLVADDQTILRQVVLITTPFGNPEGGSIRLRRLAAASSHRTRLSLRSGTGPGCGRYARENRGTHAPPVRSGAPGGSNRVCGGRSVAG